jgi:RNA polymerase sigma factor (sigma-70 family)
MNDTDSVTNWIVHLKAGRQDAADPLWRRYSESLARLALRQLGKTPRRAFDEEDVAASAFNAFLQGVDEGRFSQLDDRDDLWQVLVMLTERRAISARRRERAQKRGGGEVRGDSVFVAREGGDSQVGGFEQFAGREPTPEFALEMSETVRQLLEQLPDETLRDLVQLKLANHSIQEIAKARNVSVRTIQRKFNEIRAICERDLGDE